MKLSIGLPTGIPATPGRRLVEWATRAEGAGFASLGTIGRIVFDSHEELIALAGAAGATQRIGLATTVMVSPVREPVLLAKQAATLDALSGGRLMLGVGVGWRDDDFRATGADYRRRASLLEQQIEVMRRVWSGEAPAAETGPVGPSPARRGGPELLLGGSHPAALRRAGRLADGYLAMPLGPAEVSSTYEAVAAAAEQARRPRPRLVGAAYFALGDDVQDASRANMASYYAFGGADFVNGMQALVLRAPAAIRERIEGLERIGADELFLWPTSNGLEQIDRLKEATA